MEIVKLDENGMNAGINAHVLPEETMRKLGFTDHSKTNWYFVRGLGKGISFNLSIPKEAGRPKIDVLDEDFLQPYDYQRFIRDNPDHTFAVDVQASIERVMRELTDAGVITGWSEGDYI